jgi:hypothetical protein
MNGSPDLEQQLAAAALDDLDLQALALAREIFAASDPVPPGLADRCKFAMSVAALEAEVAEIIAAPMEAAGMRSSSTYDRAATITFSSDQLSAMITIEADEGPTARLTGWVTTGPTSVELRGRNGSQTTTTDAQGRFSFAAVEHGLVHLVLRRLDAPESRPVITPVIEI